MDLELPPVGLGQLAERLLVAGAGPGQRARGHGRIVSRGHHWASRRHRRPPEIHRSICARGPGLNPRDRTDREEDNMRRGPGWVLVVASIASLMVALDALVVTTALPTIRVHLGASIEELEWTVNAYTLSFAVLLMTGAALGDRFGRRRMFAAGLAIFSGGSAACALAPSVGLLIAARAVQGAGAALDHAARADAAERGVPARAPGARARDLQRHHRTCGARRPGRRRRDHAGDRVAVDLLDQRPDRAVDDPRRAPPRRRELRPAQRPGHRRPRARHRRRARASFGGSCAATRPAGAASR